MTGGGPRIGHLSSFEQLSHFFKEKFLCRKAWLFARKRVWQAPVSGSVSWTAVIRSSGEGLAGIKLPVSPCTSVSSTPPSPTPQHRFSRRQRFDGTHAKIFSSRDVDAGDGFSQQVFQLTVIDRTGKSDVLTAFGHFFKFSQFSARRGDDETFVGQFVRRL